MEKTNKILLKIGIISFALIYFWSAYQYFKEPEPIYDEVNKMYFLPHKYGYTDRWPGEPLSYLWRDWGFFAWITILVLISFRDAMIVFFPIGLILYFFKK